MSENNNNTDVTVCNDPKILAEQIMKETTLERTKNLIQLFNLVQSKKNVLRSVTYSDMLDKASLQMMTRITEHPDQFSNEDLLKFFTTMQTTLSKTDTEVASIKETPTIQINNTQVNVSIDEEQDALTRGEREKTIEAVKTLLKILHDHSNVEMQEAEYVEKEENIE